LDAHLLHQPLERLNKEVKRRTNVVGSLPDGASVIRLVGAVLMETSDEWQVGRRYFSQDSVKNFLEPETLLIAEPELLQPAPVHWAFSLICSDGENRDSLKTRKHTENTPLDKSAPRALEVSMS
jgi:hypothetical protein